MSQISSDLFLDELMRLHRAFPKSSGTNEVVAEKIKEWFELWNTIYPQATYKILKTMVDLAISECERLPSFAQFRAFYQKVIATLPKINFLESACSICNNTGILHATKHGCDGTFAFRCHCCENWVGKYDGIAMWTGNGEYQAVSKISFDPTNASQIKGLLLLKWATPAQYAKITERYPEMKAPVEALQKSGWEPSLFKSIPGEKNYDPVERERIRTKSLALDAKRDSFDEMSFMGGLHENNG